MATKHLFLTGAIAAAALATSAEAALVGHYQFEETAGTVLVDSSGNSFNGTVGTGGDLNVTGIVGSGFRDGTAGGQFGSVSGGTTSFGITGNNARTVSFWFNADSLPGTNNQRRLIGMGAQSAAQTFDIVLENGNNANDGDGNATTETRVGVRYGNGNVYFDADNSGTDFGTGTWYHVALVYDGSTLDLEAIGNAADGTGLQMFINGAQVNAAAGNLNNAGQAIITTASDFTIGGEASSASDSRDAFDGRFDDVQIYDEALSAGQVASLFNTPGSVIPEPSSLALLGIGGLLILKRRRLA